MVVQLAQQVLVVPPFECAWLTGDNYLLRDGKGCISFEVKGDNDVTVILKPQCGSRRWQHKTSGRLSPVEANYTVILGSHRNSCLKIEKDGELCHMASGIPGSKLSATNFTKYWVDYDGNSITVGAGEPCSTNICCRWTDAHPIMDIRFIGLSAWDKHVGYRNIRVQPTVSDEILPENDGDDNCSWSTTTAATLSGSFSSSRKYVAPPSNVPRLAQMCCSRLIEDMSPSSVCSVLIVADALAPEADCLRSRALDVAACQFSAVLAQDPAGVESLETSSLAEILQNQSLSCGEKVVFDGLMHWAAAKSLEDVEALLPHVRFPQMSPEDLQAVATHPLATRSNVFQELVREAIDATGQLQGGSICTASSVLADRLIREPTPSEAAATARFQRRSMKGGTELIYMYDGDHNGLCWYLGTRCSAQAWLNPALTAMLHVRASSPVARGTDPRALVGRTFMRTNFAGPRREPDSTLSAWWQLDLGPEHRLACNYYTLRHDGSTDFLRNWVLQGSHNGGDGTWKDLRRHKNDMTFKLPGQYASWPVGGAAAAVPYRFFRVRLLTDALLSGRSSLSSSSAAANAYRVCLSNIELYGTFYKGSECEKALHPASIALV